MKHLRCSPGLDRIIGTLPAILLFFTLMVLLVPIPAQEASSQGRLLFRESFETLDRWSHVGFPKIERRSRYSIVQKDGQSALLAQADASASFLLLDRAWSIREYPVLRWSWLVENVYQKGDGTTKAGDDFPLRIYVLFEYDPDKAGIGERLTYATAKIMYGKFPPHSSLSYVWESTGPRGRVMVNPYSDRTMEIALRSGTAETGFWRDEIVNVLEDYRKSFGKDPPDRATLAIMSDSDNTGESATAYIRFVEIGAP